MVYIDGHRIRAGVLKTAQALSEHGISQIPIQCLPGRMQGLVNK